MPVEVDIDAEQHTNVVLVPAVAIVRDADNTAVFVAAEQKAHRREVRIGLANGTEVEIVSGIKAGERVIVDGQAGLPDEAAIAVHDDVAEHRSRPAGASAHQGRVADLRRASDKQCQPQRSVHRRLRSRVAKWGRRVGGGVVEPVCGGVRPIFDERHAGAHEARLEQLDHQARQSHSWLRQGLRVRQQIRAAAIDLGAAQAGSIAVRPVLPIPVRPDRGEEPSR